MSFFRDFAEIETVEKMSSYCKRVLPELFGMEKKCHISKTSDIVSDFGEFDAVLIAHDLTGILGPALPYFFWNRKPSQR